MNLQIEKLIFNDFMFPHIVFDLSVVYMIGTCFRFLNACAIS